MTDKIRVTVPAPGFASCACAPLRRAGLLAAVDEARADERTKAAERVQDVARRHWVHRDVEADLVRAAGQPRDKTPVEKRADEIEADPTNYLAEEAIGVAVAKLARGDRTEAAAWLLIAQRRLAPTEER